MTDDNPTVDEELLAALHSLEGAPVYLAWLLQLLTPHLGGDIAEVGAGTGTMTGHLARHGRVTAVEPAGPVFEVLKNRYANDAAISTVQGGFEVLERGRFDAIVLSNVIEHIEDETTALQSLLGALRPDGVVVMIAPAHRLLMSEFDRRIGHHRRYRARPLQHRLIAAGFDSAQVSYINPIGAIGWFVTARLLRLDPTGNRFLPVFDRFVIPISRAFTPLTRRIFGQSVVAVARRGE